LPWKYGACAVKSPLKKKTKNSPTAIAFIFASHRKDRRFKEFS
jgi:hypothetical protein